MTTTLGTSFDEQSQISALPLAALGEVPRFVIGIDYGTTYTGVAWILTEGKKPTTEEIKLVTNWPRRDGRIDIQGKVPSVFTYSANSGTSWGYGIGHDAYVIRWTKLELEPPRLLDALESLKRTLLEASHLNFGDEEIKNHQVPRHLKRSPVDVMTDYLDMVARCVFDHIVNGKDRQMLRDYPVDFVITHPAVWHQKALDHTFKAVTQGFERRFQPGEVRLGNVRLASEPEACAQYTMRYAVEKKTLNLRKGECFVVVDAGGGTVDLVSYRVDQVSPHFRMSRVTPPSGGPYGATRVDDFFFKVFLPRKLRPEDLEKLNANDPRERHGQGSHKVLSRGEQAMLDSFLAIKHAFAGPRPASEGPQRPIVLDIPKWLEVKNDPARGIRNHQLWITAEEMEEMFQLSVDNTIRLIHHQIELVEGERGRVETIFLSGGFSMSEYLYKRVQVLARGYSISLVRAQDSWTAVAKGAVLMGLGVGCDVPPPVLKCPFHIGVVVAPRYAVYDHDASQRYVDSFDQVERAKNHVHWIVTRGDPINTTGFQKNFKLFRKMLRKGARTGKVSIIATNDDDERGPGINVAAIDRVSRQEIDLDYDLDRIPADTGIWDNNTAKSVYGNITYHKVEMQLEVYVTQAEANFQLLWGKTVDFRGGTATSGIPLAQRQISFPQQ